MCDVKEFDNNCCRTCYSGNDWSLFFLSPGLGIAEEIFWDFVGWLNSSRLTFTRFCKQITYLYQSSGQNSAPFVSNRTFIDAFFCWIISFHYDFRQEIDPFCGYDPKCLACDGTKVGVALKTLKLPNPITKPDTEDHIHNEIGRNERCLFHYPDKNLLTSSEYNSRCKCIRQARVFLNAFCRNGHQAFDTVEQFETEKANMVRVIGWMERDGLLQFVNLFLDRSPPSSFVATSGKLLKLLLKQFSAVSCVVPFTYADHLISMCEELDRGVENVDAGIARAREYCLEIADLIQLGIVHNLTPVVTKFLLELANFVKKIHSQDRPPPPPQPIPGTYNPPAGCAYYFTPHGSQVRKMPHYKEEKTVPEDFDPEEPVCKKDFPLVSYKGFGYIFLFFCPYHGHSYGFHIIQGGEGRKDPFSAIFKYKPTPPQELYYDFACQLTEYCLNREPGFWRCVRIWHDLFHGVTHKCHPLFISTRILGLLGTNTSICEQFNSYLQAVKYTGSHLSQLHFVLLIQFMIVQWNRAKTEKFRGIARTALQGLR